MEKKVIKKKYLKKENDATKNSKNINIQNERISWDEYFIEIAEIIKRKSTCLRRQVGAIIVKDNMILSTGFNGTPKGYINCSDGGCPRCSGKSLSGDNLDECLCNHAESNAIVQAACNGIKISGANIYTTFSPCLYCAKEIINSGIKKVYYKEEYSGIEKVKELFKYCKIEFIKLENKNE